MKIIFLLLLPYLLFVSSLTAATEQNTQVKPTRKENSLNRITANFNLTFNSLSISETGTSISGPGLELFVSYALSKKWGVGGSVKQMNLGSTGSGSGFNFRATYALWGNLLTENSKFYYDKDLIIENKSVETSCLCAQITGSQYYLNTSVSTVPFTGYGAALYYRYPTVQFHNLIGGVQYESMANTDTLTAMTIFLGIEFRI
ncbi:MAG: hypothetical protein H6621_04030 [Halobacteriovoraceae bacterium]|nr:hypothetical protein [Halobacteriovoraceae bacterium]MCB9094218.1 hypothetical protein [Halobacteriovoraceae bacterium]